MLILITYDISTETATGKKRLNQIAKCCIRYGQRVQNSVFECNISYGDFLKLQSTLKEMIDVKTDSVRFYNLGNNYDNKVIHFGAKQSIKLEDVLIV